MTVQTVGGYRLVRKLGEGSRAVVFLGHALSAAPEQTEARSAAIKIIKPHVPSDSIDGEIEALGRGDIEHRVALHDLARDESGRTLLILERLARGNLGRLLHDREVLAPGECVTIIAPIALAVAELHDEGIAHGAIRLESIGFRDSGAPVLAGFGHAESFGVRPSIATIESSSLVNSDRRALGALTRAALDRVPPYPQRDRLAEWLDSAVAAALPEGFASLLAERVFDLGEPAPIRFDSGRSAAAASHPSHPVPSRVIAPEHTASLADPEAADGGARAARTGSLFVRLERAVGPRLDRLPLADLRESAVASLSKVRKPVWIAAGAVGVALLVALAIVPPEGGAPADAVAPSAEPTAFEEDQGDVGGDDPLAAVDDLLAARERCIADLSLLCLDAVDERGSGALADDQALVRELQGGGEFDVAPMSAGTPQLVERLGDSAIVSLGDVPESQPASLLLMKGEAGWRIRQYLEG